MRQTSLAVIHVGESMDLDLFEAYRAGISDDIAKAMGVAGLDSADWQLHMAAGDDVAEKVLELAAEADAELLVIGARRRSPVGKFLLGSVTQSIVLDAPMPVLVVKAEQ
jgi:nucleotide-binding universal stress UspA family protein